MYKIRLSKLKHGSYFVISNVHGIQYTSTYFYTKPESNSKIGKILLLKGYGNVKYEFIEVEDDMLEFLIKEKV